WLLIFLINQFTPLYWHYQAKRQQPKGRGMDPPRRGGLCEADKGQLMEAPQANNLAPPSGELSAEQTEGVHLRRSRWTSTLKSQISILHFRRSREASTLKSQISNLKSQIFAAKRL
ncbi:hypothetical protein, partial [uncultured Dialister sp.]|uniref:hypothetical protein n=1 Tax=uncultured Dialister sp. TaxID=278064 RepID=UPI00265E03F6